MRALHIDEALAHKYTNRLIDSDEFIGNLWKVHLDVKAEGYVQPLSLGLFRSDYIVHSPPGGARPSLKQVEFNTIASSFAGLSDLVASMHASPELSSAAYPENAISGNKGLHVEKNHAVETLSRGLAAAHKAYRQSTSKTSLPLCIIFIVQGNERNVYDQLALSEHLLNTHKITSFRVPTTEILNVTSISASDPSRTLLYSPPHCPSSSYEVTTVYLRSLYDPADYTPDIWRARTHLERSAAIKCPSVLSQLSGCKKVQQVLADPNQPDYLSVFLFRQYPDPPLIELVRQTFAPQYDLSKESEGRDHAVNPKTAKLHVLKPQREGGGNNIYRDAIPGFLKSIPEKEWDNYVLMELIQPPQGIRNSVLKSNGDVLHGNVIGELGLYGTILWGKDGSVYQNSDGGYLYRTKGKDSDEGGVAAGFSALDSIVLV